MKILIVTQYFWPETFQINSIAARLVEKGHQVDVLTGKPNYPQGRIFEGYRAAGCTRQAYEGSTVHRIPLAPRASGAARLALNYLSFVASGLLFGPWMVRGKDPDVIFVYAPSPLLQALPAVFLGKIKRRPVVIWVQDLWPESLSATGYVKNRRVLGMVERVVRFIYRKCALLLVQSEAFVEPVRKLAPRTRIECLPNSVNDGFTMATPARPKGGDRFTVLFAGNLGAAQAVECILSAAERLREHDIRFLLVGDGSRRDWLLAEVARRGLANVELPGRFPLEAMPAMMAQASALLVTLAAEKIFEYTVPSKVQAYMAAGRPIIAALNGEGARLVTESGAGLAVPAEDGEALAEAILRLRALPDADRMAMGEKGRQYYMTHFREDIVVDKLLALLSSATSAGEEHA